MKISRSIPLSLFFKMFFGGKFYSNQFCIIVVFVLVSMILSKQTNMEIFFIFLVTTIITLIILAFNWLKGFKSLELLKYGTLTVGNYINSEITHFRHGNNSILKHTYVFYDQDGVAHRVCEYSKSKDPDMQVKVLFSKKKNGVALVVKGLAGEPLLDENGNISSVRVVDNILVYIILFLMLNFRLTSLEKRYLNHDTTAAGHKNRLLS